MSLLYKTLFEVKLMHEYFITDINGHTIFDEPIQNKRLQFLLDAYANDADSIDKELQISFSDVFKSMHDSHQLRLIPSYSGFKVMIRVNEKKLPDQSTVYEPFVPLPASLGSCIQVTRKNNLIDRYTNSRISRPLPSIYFFSNENIPGAKSFPFLSNAVAPMKPLYHYEQGEMAAFGADLMRFYKDRNGAEAWNPVTGSAFANEGDRMLLPMQFKYTFEAADKVTQASFVLKDNNGNELKTITASGTAPLRNTTLDFSDKAIALSPDGNTTLSDSVYTLQVSGDNGYQFEQPVIFSNQLYDESTWAIILIRLTAKNTQFNLLDADGRLITHRDPNNILTDPPVFELSIPSRFGYWRYINNRGSKLDLPADLTGYLFISDNGLLQTLTPRTLSKRYFLLTNDLGTETKYLPNPVNYGLIKDEEDRICFDIKVPESDLFPVLP
jgi:hypothetical protein